MDPNLFITAIKLLKGFFKTDAGQETIKNISANPIKMISEILGNKLSKPYYDSKLESDDNRFKYEHLSKLLEQSYAQVSSEISSAYINSSNSLEKSYKLDFNKETSTYMNLSESFEQHLIQDFNEKTLAKVSNMPPEKYMQPPKYFLNRAINTSKYYYEDADYSNWFSNLLAASINVDNEFTLHPSFIDIITQISPLDAQNLKIIYEKMQCPVCKYQLMSPEVPSSSIILENHIFLSNINFNIDEDKSYIPLLSSSLENLKRLGVIDIAYESFITDNTLYEEFYNTNFFNEEKSIKAESPTIRDGITYNQLDVKKGTVSITNLGKNFYSICFIDPKYD